MPLSMSKGQDDRKTDVLNLIKEDVRVFPLFIQLEICVRDGRETLKIQLNLLLIHHYPSRR